MLWKKPSWVVTCTRTITRQNDCHSEPTTQNSIQWCLPNPIQRRPQNGLALPLAEERLYPIYTIREVEEIEKLG